MVNVLEDDNIIIINISLHSHEFYLVKVMIIVIYV